MGTNSNAPSLRRIASELEISPAYLSYMVNGKRPWRKDLLTRYQNFVNKGDSVNTKYATLDTKSPGRLLYTQEAAGSSPALPTSFPAS